MWHKGKKPNSVTISYDYHDMLSGSLIFYFLQFNNSQAYLDKIVVRILQAPYHCLLNSNPCSVPCIHDPTLYLPPMRPSQNGDTSRPPWKGSRTLLVIC